MTTLVALSTLRGLLGQEIGLHATPFSNATPVGPDPARWLLLGHIVATSTKLRSDGSDPATWVGGWAYPTFGDALGQTRRIAHVVPELGAVAVDAPFSATVTLSTPVEVSHPLPVASQNGVIGLNELLVMALRDLWAEDRISLTTVANQRSYSLAAYAAWLDDADRILTVYDPPRAAGAPRRPSARRWEYRTVAGVPTLDFVDRGYPAAGFTFQVEVRRPCWTLVNGAESSAGPSSSSDTVLCDREEVVEVAKLHAWRWLAGWRELEAANREQYAKLAADQETRVRRLEHYDGRERATTEAA